MDVSVLLIGGSGTLSCDVTQLSVEAGYDVFILNRGTHNGNIDKRVKVIKADISKRNEVNAALGALKFDVVVDFLSYKPAELERNLSVFQGRCSQYIFISSACVYGNSRKNSVLTETSPLGNKQWAYGSDKEECELLLKRWAVANAVNYTIVRPYITYGDTRIPYGIMPPYGFHWTFAARILNEKPVFLWDDGEALCTITHTKDFAKGLVGLYCNESAFDDQFNIVGDEVISWKKMLSLIGKILSVDPIVINIPTDFIVKENPSLRGILVGDRSLNAVFDNTKIKKAVPEFISAVPLSEGIARTIEYYRSHAFVQGIDYGWEGETDRLILRYIRKRKDLSPLKKKIHFMDFLGNATLQDRLVYSMARVFSVKVVLTIKRLFRFMRRVFRTRAT